MRPRSYLGDGPLGTVELGGTKTLAAFGRELDDIKTPLLVDTGDPETTLEAIGDYLDSGHVTALGVASFGPVELRPGHERFGHITRTPKRAWASTDIVGFFETRLGVPIRFDTDVNAAALGEWKWGAARGLRHSVYVTVGTGIGGGLVIDGHPLHGTSHPEMGHTIVMPHPDDPYAGHCPYHGACLEGMASGPAIEDRFGRAATALNHAESEEALRLVAFYLGQGLRNIVYTVAPDRIIIGGGVSHLPGFHSAVSTELAEQLAGYPGLPEHVSGDFVVAPGLGGLSGLAGGLILAEHAGNR
ncbi:MAG: ROK family protein [Acidimicrobiia bacterium]